MLFRTIILLLKYTDRFSSFLFLSKSKEIFNNKNESALSIKTRLNIVRRVLRCGQTSIQVIRHHHVSLYKLEEIHPY